MSSSITGAFAQRFLCERVCSPECGLCLRLVALKQVKHTLKSSFRHRCGAIMKDPLRQFVENRESLRKLSLQHQKPHPNRGNLTVWIDTWRHLRNCFSISAKSPFNSTASLRRSRNKIGRAHV